MKTFLYVFHMLVIACVGFFLGGCFRKKVDKVELVEIKNTTMFNYSYSVGCYMNGNYRMGYNLTDNKYIAYYKGDGIPDEEKITKEISKEKVLELEKIITKLNVSKWDGFR